MRQDIWKISPNFIDTLFAVGPNYTQTQLLYRLQFTWILSLPLDIIQSMDDLLLQCLDGHSWAWDAFVARYAPVILATVQHVLRTYSSSASRQTADDIVQDIFLKLIDRDFRLLRTYDPDRASLKTWLAIVARSTAIDSLRRKHLPTIALDMAPPIATAQIGHQKSPNPTQDLPAHLLTPRQQLVLHLLFDREMSPDDAAELLGIATQTVRSAKHKAIQRLRDHFAPEDSG